ncbi:uncharacterized protein LOC144625650 [Crassostrea virginica]
MSISNKFKEFILASGRAPRGLTWSFWFLVIIYALFLAGICTDNWLESSIVMPSYDHRIQGLWKFCYGAEGRSCCAYINEIMFNEAFLDATRAFIIMSIFPQLLCLFAICKGISSERYPYYTKMGAASAAFSAVFIILAIIIYGAASSDENSISVYSPSWSYGLCVTSGVAYILLACFFYWTRNDTNMNI